MNDDVHRYDKLILVLALVPAAFGALFQGGYFTWQAYLMMLLALPAVLLFVVTRSRYGWARAGGAVDVTMLAFLGVCALSMVATVYFQATLVAFFKVLFCGILFYVVFNVTRRTAQLDLAVSMLLGLGALLSLIGLLGYAGASSQLTGPFWTWLGTHSLTQDTSVTSTLQYRNTFAAFLILPMFLALARALDVRRWWARVLYGALAGFFVVMLILSQSRGGLLAFLITLILFPVMLPRGQRLKGILAVFLLVAALALTFWLRRDVFVPMLLSMTVRIKQLFAFVGGVQDASLYARVVMIRDSWAMLLRRPVLGTGAGTYQYVYTQFRSIPFYAKFPHSIIFEQLVEMGILGGVAFLALIGSLLWRGLRIARREGAAVFAGLLAGAFGNVLHAAVDFDWSLLAMPVLFFVTCGLLVSRERREPGATVAHVAMGYHHAPRSARLLTGVAFVVVVWGFVFVILLSAANTALAQRAEAQGDLPSAQYRYRTAVRLAPFGAEQKADLAAFLQAHVEGTARDQDEVGREVQQLYETAARLNPRMWAYHDALARLYLDQEDPRAGVEAQAAVDRNPLRADGWFILAVARDAAGDQAGAGQAFDRAVQLQEQGNN
ncbi:MAG TPA: O-antigen ligase family protein [Candidatus Cryosericum sp.]